MENQLTDEQLLNELKRRFDENRRTLDSGKKLIDELNAVNAKLLASEDLKSNFLSNIRNEINNPITSILELSKNISEGNLTEDSVKRFAALIYLEAFDLDFQLKNVFLSAEIEAGESPLSVSSIHISSFIKGIVASFDKKIAKKKIEMTLNLSIEENQIFKTDTEKLHLILSNIIANAVHFNHPGGTIKVDANIDNDEKLVVKIHDSGIGISQENIEKIYDRFHQVEEGSTKTYGGHGLGLCITKSLLEILDGDIKVESKLGEGSLFTITINPLQGNEENDVFSSDGNDFLFGDDDSDDMLF